MDYSESAPPPHLAGLIKARWSLAAGARPGEWIEQQATPDGCVEIIRRTAGRSRWDGDQPDSFVVGLVDRVQPFEVSGDSRFEALRLWPWAWSLVGDIPLASLHGRWAPWRADFDAIGMRLAMATDLNAIGGALISAQGVAAMGAATGMPPRMLQRWFARHVGLPPRTWLRLIRFQSAFETLPGEPSLAGHAAAQGFADQAHMAREFRALAGVPATTARRRARGPFLG
ncbi:helix-turn-helix domain-containing protein [Sphingopyxis sp. BSN-002]|uniref:AraC family transcriptional regulator n=1 Tax=Sphingopyxis sp. BSN-002 TaxID=2911495 RepID=UPI001EDC151C|nr:helix-turn-helix domain-containing protein [Sphingopyxis sp. BSN-002]UKK83313.1 helix-turn-helix domain-containing protein [Sphingopyxis sp. BSN-002]